MSKIRNLPRDPDVVCANCGHPDCVWAHLRFHDSGVGQKCADLFGAPLCRECHDYADSRAKHDRMGHSNGGSLDYVWLYRVLRKGQLLLIRKGLMNG